MWLREVVFQGVFGSSRPSRIRVEQGVCHVQLPETVPPRTFARMILSILYPTQIPESEVASWADQGNVRIGTVIEHDDRVFKVFRQVDPATVVIQDITRKPVNIARGASKVAVEMMSLLGLPDWEDFTLLHTWDFSPRAAPPAGGGGGALPSDPEARRLALMYQDALAVEACDLRIENARAAIHDTTREHSDLRNSLGNVDHLERELEGLAGVANISDEDRALVEQNNERESRFKGQLDQLERDLEDAEIDYEESGSTELKREVLIWGTALIAIILYIVSFVLSMKSLALINILVLGGTCSGVLRRYSKLERVHKTKAKVDQLQRRIDVVEKSRTAHKNSFRDILSRVNAHDTNDFWMNIEAHEDITQQLAEFREKAEDSAYQGKLAVLDKRLKQQEEALEALTQERKELGDYTLPSYEIERSLEGMGVDPRKLKKKEEPEGEPRLKTDTAVDVMPHLAALADKRGLLNDGRLNARLGQMWEKLVVHLGGKNWAGVTLGPRGDLLPPVALRNGFGDWARRRPEVARLLAGSLSAAIMASTPSNNPYSRCRFICLVEPYTGLDAKRRERLDKVFASLESRANMLILG